MPDLVLDLPTLEQLSTNLTAVTSTFENASSVSHQLGEVGVVGDSDLAGRAGAFANGWDIRRGKITAAMEAINASVKAVHDTFQQVDVALANALTQGES